MEIQEYLNHKKELNEHLIKYIESDDVDDESFLTLQNYFQSQQDLKYLVYLILNISDNHHRDPLFFNKIERILLSIEKDIKQIFSNSDLFELFLYNKRILLFLIQNKIITLERSIINELMKMKDENGKKYCHFFYQELINFDPKLKKLIEFEMNPQFLNYLINNEEKRKIGENDSYVCCLIREDSVEEFISFCTRTNLSMNSKIQPSIYETNSFLLENNNLTLIEYAAFFGSIQIFQFLKMNNANLNKILWPCAIHSKNAELIHLLEENQIKPKDETYEDCLKEAIKCHHNDIAEYIEINLLNYFIKNKKDIDKSVAIHCFHNSNFKYMPNDVDHQILFFLACEYNDILLVNLLLKTGKIDINAQLI